MHGKGVVGRSDSELEGSFLASDGCICAAYINGEKAPNPPPLSPPVPFLSYYPLPSGPLLPPILPPSHHSLTLMPSSPSLKPLQSPCFKFQVYIAWLHNYQDFKHFRRPKLDTVACIHRVKQTIVHMILSRSVHQNTYGDVIKAFCKKKTTSLLTSKDTSE